MIFFLMDAAGLLWPCNGGCVVMGLDLAVAAVWLLG